MSFFKKLFGQAEPSKIEESIPETVPEKQELTESGEIPVYKITSIDGVEVSRELLVITPPVVKVKPPIISNKTFKASTVLGIECIKKDEKLLLKKVNDYLALFDRKTGTMKNASILAIELPFVIKYYHWNHNKSAATAFDIKQNEDVEGKWYFPELKQFAWILTVRIDHSGWERIGELTLEKLQETHDFLNGLLDAVAFKTVPIFETDDIFWKDKVDPYKNKPVCSSFIERNNNG